MTSHAGKRKRRDDLTGRTETASSQNGNSNSSRLQELFKKHFEATFDPLPEPENIAQSAESHDESTNESAENVSDWEGISESVNETVEIVQHDRARAEKSGLPIGEHKTFMSSKPPINGEKMFAGPRKRKASDEADDAGTNAANLKKDLALQRLLQESHLLEQDNTLSHTSSTRHKALDVRLQKLGSKSSLYGQHKMPMAQRKGIDAKATEREETRRREARENGIILEKAGKTDKKAQARRQRGIGAPGVGKFRNGMLTLSKKDVHQIQGPKRDSRRR